MQTLLRPRAHRAVGRLPPASRAGRRAENRESCAWGQPGVWTIFLGLFKLNPAAALLFFTQHVALLQRPHLRSFRRRALFRRRGGAAAEPARSLALVPAAAAAWHQGEVAGLGAVAFCRLPAAARRRRDLPCFLCRPRQLADPDRG